MFLARGWNVCGSKLVFRTNKILPGSLLYRPWQGLYVHWTQSAIGVSADLIEPLLVKPTQAASALHAAARVNNDSEARFAMLLETDSFKGVKV